MSEDLNLDVGWRIGEENFVEIVNQLEKIGPNVIVEFGSGASSIRLSKAFKSAKIYSIEHDMKYFREAKGLRKTHGAENLHLIWSPLKWQVFGMAIYESYGKAHLPNQIDAVIIDGPPHSSFNGREACLYQVYKQLRVGGVVLLDDFDRAPEKSVVAHWLTMYPGAFLQSEGGRNNSICILLKNRNIPATRNWASAVTSYSQLISKAYNSKKFLRARKVYVAGKNWLKDRF